MPRTPIVYIPNKGGHDYSAAEKFGTLVFLTEGKIKRYSTSTIYREMIEGMEDAEPGDYILISSLSILNAIATSIQARKFGKLNLLLFRDGEYLPRNLDVDSLL